MSKLHADLNLPYRELPITGMVIDDLVLPSGLKVSVRETNGEDDEVISRLAKLEDGTSLSEYLTGVIQAGPDGRRMSLEEVGQLKLRDRQFILLVVRILSLGKTLKFKHECQSPSCIRKREAGTYQEFIWEDDLTQFIQDLSKPVEVGKNGINRHCVEPYPDGNQQIFEFILSDNETKIKFKALTGDLENKGPTSEEDLNQNSPLYQRELEIFDDGKYVRPSTFRGIPSRKMAEIRNIITKHDGYWQPITEIKCPHCKTIKKANVLSITDFFFPGEI